MSERVHEVLEEERRPGHEDEQRQLRVSKPKVRRNSATNKPAVTSQVTPPSANTSHTGTFATNSATIAPISARLMKPK